MPSKTRKKKTHIRINLTYLPKKGGSRHEGLTTFKTSCDSKDSQAHLLVTKSIKAPEENTDFVHVLESTYKNTTFVIKVLEPSYQVYKELAIHKLLSDQPNIVQYICDFQCNVDNLIITKPINQPYQLCTDDGQPFHIIVMEHINTDLAEYLKSNDVPEHIFVSIVKQIGFCLLNIHVNYSISHNDINRGNLLLKIDNTNQQKEITYTIHNNISTVQTYGHEFILIDFERGSILDQKYTNVFRAYVNIYNNMINNNYDNYNEYNNINNNMSNLNNTEKAYRKYGSYVVLQARDEITIAYSLLSRWTSSPKYKTAIKSIAEQINETKPLNRLFSLIDTFTV
jgi:serine/threonine protein kinase